MSLLGLVIVCMPLLTHCLLFSILLQAPRSWPGKTAISRLICTPVFSWVWQMQCSGLESERRKRSAYLFLLLPAWVGSVRIALPVASAIIRWLPSQGYSSYRVTALVQFLSLLLQVYESNRTSCCGLNILCWFLNPPQSVATSNTFQVFHLNEP